LKKFENRIVVVTRETRLENDFIAFNSGAEAVIGLADKRGRMVV
jgi:hypothetical protein